LVGICIISQVTLPFWDATAEHPVIPDWFSQPPFNQYDVSSAFSNPDDYASCVSQWNSRDTDESFPTSPITVRGKGFPHSTLRKLAASHVHDNTVAAMAATVWSDFTYDKSVAPTTPGAIALEHPHDNIHGNFACSLFKAWIAIAL
jgi:hypothetical protein